MFGLGVIQKYVMMGMGASMLAMAGTIWFLDGKIENKNLEITAVKSQLTVEKAAHLLTTTSFENNVAAFVVVQEETISLNERLRELGEVNNVLEDKLARHDLEALSLAKPVLVERIINSATADVMDRIEIITGGRE